MLYNIIDYQHINECNKELFEKITLKICVNHPFFCIFVDVLRIQ